MTATLEDLHGWYKAGKKQKGVTHVIICHDTFDHDNYPKYAKGPEDLQKKLTETRAASMQSVDEVYDLTIPFDTRSNRRVMQLPEGVA